MQGSRKGEGPEVGARQPAPGDQGRTPLTTDGASRHEVASPAVAPLVEGVGERGVRVQTVPGDHQGEMALLDP